ncbi:MAG: hypothetical protein LDL31_06470 [Prosthecobacter sp.]|jgi:hypothetical protein|nr:hypothetical protein [Prosthecobacter sp.]
MTASEQRLAVALGIILVAGGAFVGLGKMKAWKLRVDLLAREVADARAEAEELLARKDFWDQRSAWLAEKQPPFTKPAEAISSILNAVDELAARHGVSIPFKQPNESSERAGLTSAAVTLKVVGEMKPVMNWLYDLQQPESFIAVPAMTITPSDQESSKIELNLRVEKWFRLPAS